MRTTIIAALIAALAGQLPAQEEVIQRIPLHRHWNLISLRVDPGDDFREGGRVSMRRVVARIEDRILLIKDSEGRFCLIGRGYWGIETWDAEKCYWFKMAEEATLEVTGVEIPFDRPISLRRGWNSVAFYPDYGVDHNEALDGLRQFVQGDENVFMKDGYGRFYHFRFRWNYVEPLRPNGGVMIKIEREAEFRWPARQ